VAARAHVTAMPHPTSSADTGEGTYVYGVVPAGTASPELFAGVEGVAPERRVEVLEHGRVAALVSRVPLAEFGEEALGERLQDPAWLAEKAQAHSRVLRDALAAGAVVPFRFGAIFRGETDVSALLAAREADLTARLRHVSGRVEIGVKAVAPQDFPERVGRASEEPRRLEAELAGAPPGRRYLLQKQLQQVVAREASAVRTRIADESHAALAAVAVAATVNQPQDLSGTGLEGEMLLNGAYLVPEDEQQTLVEHVEALRARYAELGVRFDVTGPWPPFNFVTVGAE
jgi:hypothetical protein